MTPPSGGRTKRIAKHRGVTPKQMVFEIIEHQAMVTIAHKTGATAIAEGIETEEELRVLRELGVDYGQGFLLGKPVPSKTWTLHPSAV